jgi:hypothetical protein
MRRRARRLERLAWLGWLVCASCRGGGPAAPSAASGSALDVAIYHEGGAVVVERRMVELAGGVEELVLGELPVGIEAGSLFVRPPAGARVIERRLEGPLGPGALLAGALGQPVVLDTLDGPVAGTLIVAEADTVAVRRADADVVVPRSRLRGVALGGGASATRLRVKLAGARPGRAIVELGYRLPAAGWRVHYGIELVRAPLLARLTARATVGGLGAGGERRATVALLTGGLGRTTERPVTLWSGQLSLGPRPVTVELARDVPLRAELELVYRGAIDDPSTADREPQFGTHSQGEVVEQLVFAPAGLPVLPPGRVLVAERLGEVPVETATDLAARATAVEPARLRLQIASTLRGERRQVSVERSADGKQVTERYELVVKSSGAERAVVHVHEPLARGGEVEVRSAEPTPARRGKELDFGLNVPPGGEAKATYEAIYRW